MVAYKDPKTNKWYFQVAVKNENGKWVTKKRRGFDKKKEALQAEQEFLKRLKEEKISHKTPFKKIAKDYMNYSVGRKKESTIYKQNNVINNILIPHFKNKIMSEITPREISFFYNEMLKKYSEAYIKNLRAHLSAIFNYAIDFHDLPKNVVKIVKIPKNNVGYEEGKKVKYWTLDQFILFIEQVDHPIYKTLFILLFWTGLRKGEALALKSSDIDFNTKTISVTKNWNGKSITTPKNKNSVRQINAPQIVIDNLKMLISFQKDKYKHFFDEDFLFSAKNKNQPLSLNEPNNKLKRYTEDLNIPKIRVHDLRHSNASLLINNGLSLYNVSKHLGHSDIQTTSNIYGHMYSSSAKKISNLLDELASKK